VCSAGQSLFCISRDRAGLVVSFAIVVPRL